MSDEYMNEIERINEVAREVQNASALRAAARERDEIALRFAVARYGETQRGFDTTPPDRSNLEWDAKQAYMMAAAFLAERERQRGEGGK